MFLSGIKRGKKKKQKKTEDAPKSVGTVSDTGQSGNDGKDSNASVADLLRESIASGKPLDQVFQKQRNMRNKNGLEGRIQAERVACSTEPDTVLLASKSQKPEADMTIQELLEAERTNRMTPAELATRNAVRLGRKCKMKLKHVNGNNDSDEEERHQLDLLRSDTNNDRKSQRRQESRALAQHNMQASQTKHCWWWIEAPTFDKTGLVSLGQHVSLSLAPPNLSIYNENDDKRIAARHFYLVPLSHCESLANASDDVWNEIRQFQASLVQVYNGTSKKQTLVSTELYRKRGFHQAYLECMLVDEDQASDASLYFRTALTDQAEEWGTHQKLLTTNRSKDLRRTVPGGNRFAYFYVEYNEARDGYAQLIENSFPRTLATDTLCGMLGQDPVRMRRKQVGQSTMKQRVESFQTFYTPHDWTAHLE